MKLTTKPNGLVACDGLLACDDCMIVMANGDYSGIPDDLIPAVKAGIARLAKTGYAVVGNDTGFRKVPCDCCLTRLHGTRHEFSLLMLKPAPRDDQPRAGIDEIHWSLPDFVTCPRAGSLRSHEYGDICKPDYARKKVYLKKH